MTSESRQQIVQVVEKKYPLPYYLSGDISDEDLDYFEDAGLNARIEKSENGTVKEVMLFLA